MNEALAFDWGKHIIGILDINTGLYTPYRTKDEIVRGAERIVSSTGNVVSFNGNVRDLVEIAKILGVPSGEELAIRGVHNDMLEITSIIRYPPRDGTGYINGPGLDATFEHFFGKLEIKSPPHINDDYEISNWKDCYKTAELWKKWRRGELRA